MNGVVAIAFAFLIATLSPTLVFAGCMACHQGEAVESEKTVEKSVDVKIPAPDHLNE